MGKHTRWHDSKAALGHIRAGLFLGNESRRLQSAANAGTRPFDAACTYVPRPT